MHNLADSPPTEPNHEARRESLLGTLIRRARAGDRAAFEQLYDSTAAWLLARIRRTVRDGQCEDVLAEAYLKVWRLLPSYDEQRAVPSVWLAVIARSTALDHLRKEKCRSADGPDGRAFHLHVEEFHTDGPEQRLSRSQDCALVQLSLGSLSAQERMVMGLAYFRDCSQREIAAATGLSLGAVKFLMSTAQGKLRNHLGASTRGPAASMGFAP